MKAQSIQLGHTVEGEQAILFVSATYNLNFVKYTNIQRVFKLGAFLVAECNDDSICMPLKYMTAADSDKLVKEDYT